MFRSDEKAKRLAKELESHSFEENGNEYEASEFVICRYAKNKRAKLQNSDAHLRSIVKDAPPIFRGLVMSVNGYTNPSLIDLHRIIVQYGGVFLQYMDKKSNITHMIASNLTLKKKVEFSQYKVVRPEWIVDSVAAGVLLPWRDYRLLDDVKNQTKLGYQSPGSPAITKRNSLREPSSYKQSSALSLEKPKSRFERDVVIPPSDEQEWDDDFFPSYQRPPSSGKEASDAKVERRVYDNGVDPPPSHQPSPPEGDEGEYIVSPVGLVNFPSSNLENFVGGADNLKSPKPKLGRPPSPAGIVKGKLAYEPECIIGRKRHPSGAKPKNRRGQIKYLVKWRGYSNEESTWEFERDLKEDLGKKELEEMVNDFKILGAKKTPELLKPESISFTSDSTDNSALSQKENLGSHHPHLGPQVKVSVEIPDQSHSTLMSPRRSWKFDRVGGGDGGDGDDDTQKDPSFIKETFIAPPSQTSSLPMPSSPPLGGQRMIEEDLSSFEDNNIPIELDTKQSMGSPEEGTPRESNISENRLPSPPVKKEPSPITRPSKRTLDREEGESPLAKKIPNERVMTAEEFNATLLADPNVRASSALDPGFLEKYFDNSRLHHLSNWKAELRAEMQALAAAKSSQHKSVVKARQRRYVLHVDFDCFFAAVSTRDRPDLKGVPVAITHANSINSTSSEIASCNYAARAFGLKNGMWMKQAKELCPKLVCLSYDFEKYEEASKAFYGVILSINGERVQALSVDEVLLDVSNLVCDIGLHGAKEEETKALEIAQTIRNRCREETGGCEVSIGIGKNMLLAKLAMRKAKPAGMYIVREEEIDQFLDDTRVRDLPGFGHNITKKVEEHFKADTVRLVKGISRERLKVELGEKTGEKLWRYCRGIDDTLVGQDASERKTISVDVNYGIRFVTQDQADKFVMDVAGLLQRRMEKERVKAKKLYLQVKKRAAGAPMMTSKHLGHGSCDTVNKSVSLGAATSEKEIMGKETVAMLRSFRISPGELRGIGLSAANLETAKAHSSQTKLDFSKRAGEERNDNHVFLPPPLPLPPPPPPPPVQKPRLVPYVKPKPTTLLDSFAKMGPRKEQVQKPKPPQPPAQRPQPPSPPHSPPMSQFLIPSQVDPDVLEEIRQSIREEAARQKRAGEEEAEAQLLRQHEGPGEETGKVDDLELDLLPNSQVDAEVWKEMSKEDKALYLAMQEEDRQQQQQQQRPPPPPPPAAAQLLRSAPPQSPRKSRHLPWSKKGPPTPTKRRKTMSAQQQQKSLFPPAANPPSAAAPVPAAKKILDANGIDVSSWLFTTGQVNKPLFETLDAETQQDVISEARKHHTAHLALQEKSMREAAALQQRLANATVLPPLDRQRYLGPERIPVGNITEIRSMMEGWFAAAKGGQPDRKDVDLVRGFLKRLVVVELNMEKASTACRIFRRIVEEGFREEEDGVGEEVVDEGWRGVVGELIDAVQEGVRERGYGPLDI
ncbi:unnamed protein product [Tuber melanosporum]|uniref:DNA repair protein REV1 n=1 Tax=Tuber melanosporum (strain Mel28) TaxID=656061 RepID=D5GFD3_TUBMM|nr:uncharacterized protein GSTUM_00006839001 [Tuber melanosporum]CAZ83226.1 unnamed protein product [Tuber melanosporum]